MSRKGSFYPERTNVVKKRALITGITGQDGSYLAELLLEKDYEILGLIRRTSKETNELGNVKHLENIINFEYADLTDLSSLERPMISFKPHEIYNLAAQSHVRVSFDNPIYTAQVTGLGVLNMLEAFRHAVPNSRFYQASSSEMFGNFNITGAKINENVCFEPVSPYGCAKVFAHNLCQNYKRAYNLFITCGILFNHESPRRGENFVTGKVCKAAAAIYLGQQDHLELGNLDSSRDWGHAKDYVKGMWLMINHSKPDNFILATGVTHSIRDLCETAFDYCELNYKNYVQQNPKFIRAEELDILLGDASKAKEELGWEPQYSFNEMIREMCNYWFDKLKKENNK